MAVEEDSSDNHGVTWWRGPLLGKGGFASVYLTFLKKFESRRALQYYGEETTMSKDGKMLYNIFPRLRY